MSGENRMLKILKDYLILSLGTLLYCMAWDFFLIPNDFTSGGLTGLCTVIQFATAGKIPVAYSFLTMNAFLVIAGSLILGKGFGFKTIYCILLSTILFKLLPQFDFMYSVPGNFLYIDSRFLVSVIAGAMEGIGLCIVFWHGGSTGGSDIIALVLNKYWPISIGKVFLATDTVIIASILLTPGHTVNDMVYGYVVMFMSAFTLDYLMLGRQSSVQVMIFSKMQGKITDYIMHEMNRGVTAIKARGCYSGEDSEVLFVVVRKSELREVTRAIKYIDKDAFVSVVSASSVYGEGFEEIKTGIPKKNAQDIKENYE